MRWMLTLVTGLLLCIWVKTSSDAATRQELNSEIASLTPLVSNELKQNIEVVNALNVVIASPLTLTVGTVQGNPGQQINLPVYWKESSTRPVAGLQFDIVISSGLTPLSVTPGIAAQAAGKNIQGNAVQTGYRVLIFGLNQTALPTGPIALIRVQIASNAGRGKRTLSLTNIAASDPNGTTVAASGRTGSVTIR